MQGLGIGKRIVMRIVRYVWMELGQYPSMQRFFFKMNVGLVPDR